VTHHLVYMTTSNEAEAEAICSALVRERLAACANILGTSKSLYWWEGKVQTDSETAVVLKTTGDKLEALTEKAKNLHSYDCPCIVAVNIQSGNLDFLNWIENETK